MLSFKVSGKKSEGAERKQLIFWKNIPPQGRGGRLR